MSHFSRVKTKIRNLVSLMQALEDLGMEFEHGLEQVRVRGWMSQEEVAELVIRTGTRYDIGARRTATGEYELIADWATLSDFGITEESLVQRIMQRYAYHEVKAQVEEQGYSIEEEVEEEGQIRLKVVTWQ